jgi:hypothetical protein
MQDIVAELESFLEALITCHYRETPRVDVSGGVCSDCSFVRS